MTGEPLRFPAVFAQELEVVRARRRQVDSEPDDARRIAPLLDFAASEHFRLTNKYLPPRKLDPAWRERWPLQPDGPVEGDAPRDEPAAAQLVGLALSGGGIRSAATCLGAMQGLDAKNVMRLVDYLSSVSGGGYAAACLNTNIAGVRTPDLPSAPPAPAPHRRGKTGAADPFPTPPPGWIFPFPHAVGIRETVLFRYLRANAQFLIPHGRVLEYGFAPVLLLRGLFLNLWALLPLVLLLSALTIAMLGCPRLQTGERVHEMFAATAALLGVFWAAFFVISRPVRNLLERGHEWLGRLVLLAAGLGLSWLAAQADRAYGVIAIGIVVAILIGEWIRKWQFDRAHRTPTGSWRQESGAGGLARESYRQAQALALMVSAGLLFVMLQPVATYWVVVAFENKLVSGTGVTALVAAISASAWLGRFEKLPEAIRKILLLIAAALVGPVLLWGGSLLLSAQMAIELQDEAGNWALALVAAAFFLVVALILWALNVRFFYNANDVSPHSHYRDKIANTFQFSANLGDIDTVKSRSEMRLSQMNVDAAPFPVINAALNFADRDEYRGRGRNATFFTFSPSHVGSTELGYVATADIEAVHSRFKLSSAVAISGAAAAANAGRITNPALRFLLALVNVRLGYWLPNPRFVAAGRFKSRWWRGGHAQPGALHLVREMIGALDTHSAFVNLSDGGHLENLGIYELIRRRCRVIIAIDAEQDAAFSFKSLGDIIRFARIDRAVNIEIDVSDIRPDARGFSKGHAAIGRIDYGRGEYGWLIYIKNGLTGREGESILKYRAVEKLFPHHSTNDQFFDEEQFEAYRELGYRMVIETFDRMP